MNKMTLNHQGRLRTYTWNN